MEGPFDLYARQEAHAIHAKHLRRIEERTYTTKDVTKIQTRIKHQGNNLLTALLHPNVPLTNNHAERQIRPIAVTRKISGGSRSKTGATIHAVNMTILQTMALRGQNYFEEIKRLLLVPQPMMGLGKGE